MKRDLPRPCSPGHSDCPAEKTIFMISPVFHPEVGGIESHLLDLEKALRTQGGFRAIVATFQPIFTRKRQDSPPVERIGCFEVHRFRWIFPGLFDRLAHRNAYLAELYLAPYYLLRTAWLLWSVRRTIHIIHAHGMMAAIVGRLLARIAHRPLIVSSHAVYRFDIPRFSNRLMRRVLRGAARILALSRQSAEEIRGLGIDAAAIRVYRHWIDETLFYPADKQECRASLGWPDRFIVLFAGRFLEVKGFRLILSAARRLPEGVVLALVGGGPLEKEAQELAREHPQVLYCGAQSNDSMYRIYSASDVLLMPSLWEEGCGRILLEAMLCGIPVIGSRRGAIPDMIGTDKGIVIEPGDETLGGAIFELKQDPMRVARMGQQARRYALETFSSKNADVFIEAYREVMQSAR